MRSLQKKATKKQPVIMCHMTTDDRSCKQILDSFPEAVSASHSLLPTFFHQHNCKQTTASRQLHLDYTEHVVYELHINN